MTSPAEQDARPGKRGVVQGNVASHVCPGSNTATEENTKAPKCPLNNAHHYAKRARRTDDSTTTDSASKDGNTADVPSKHTGKELVTDNVAEKFEPVKSSVYSADVSESPDSKQLLEENVTAKEEIKRKIVADKGGVNQNGVAMAPSSAGSTAKQRNEITSEASSGLSLDNGDNQKSKVGTEHVTSSSDSTNQISNAAGGEENACNEIISNESSAQGNTVPTPDYQKELPSMKAMTEEDMKRKIAAAGKALFGMISNDKFHAWDIVDSLNKQPIKIRLGQLRDDSGHNILHHAITETKSQFVSMMFYLGEWEELTTQKVDVKGSHYLDLAAKEIAENVLPKAKGPQVMEEYEYYDNLANDLSMLSKACLLANKQDVEHLITKFQVEELWATDISGFNAFAYAAVGGSVPILELLLNQGVNPITVNDRQETTLHLAAKYGKTRAVQFLLSRCMVRPEIADKYHYRAIDYVAQNGDIVTMKALIQSEVRPDDKCVVLAAKHQRKDMVKFLLEDQHLSVSGKDDNGRTGFLNAAWNGDVEIAKVLLSHRPNLLDTDKYGRNCFHLAADNNKDDMLAFLIQQAMENCSLAPLINANDKFCGREIVLLVRGRDRGRPAWHFVEIKRHMMHLFRAQLAKGSIDVKLFGRIMFSGFGKSPDPVAREQVEGIFKDRLEEATENLYMTPLHIAAFKDYPTIIEKLLTAGADPNQLDYFGQTPLHLVAMRGHMPSANLMEVKGAKFDIKDKDGNTADDVAHENDHDKMVNFLRGKEYVRCGTCFCDAFLGVVQQELADDQLENLHPKDLSKHIENALRKLGTEISTTTEILKQPTLKNVHDNRDQREGLKDLMEAESM